MKEDVGSVASDKMEKFDVPLSRLYTRKRKKGFSGSDFSPKKDFLPKKDSSPLKDLEPQKDFSPLKVFSRQKDSESKKKMRKKSRAKNSESESDDKEFVVYAPKKEGRRKSNGSSEALVRKSTRSSSRLKKELDIDDKKVRSAPVKCKEVAKNVGEKFKEAEIGNKRSRLDVFEVTEDDLIDLDITKSKKESETVAGRSVVGEKRKRSKFDEGSGLVVKPEMKEKGALRRGRKPKQKSGDLEKPVGLQGKTLTKNIQASSQKNSLPIKVKRGRKKKEDSDASLQKMSKVKGARSSEKGSRSRGKVNLEFDDPPLLIERKKRIPKEGSLLMKKTVIREKIQQMLVDAGWKIDYRLRKTREYADAVYVDLKGHVHWSSLKAYNVLLKQFQNDKSGSESSNFTPIPEESLRLLNRITTKKKERENMMNETGNSGAKNVKETPRMKKLLKKSKGNRVSGGKLKVFGLKRKTLTKRSKVTHIVNKDGVHTQQGRKSKKQGGRALLVRNSDKCSDFTGKTTVLSWLIDSETVPLNGKVKYMNKKHTRAILDGTLTREGIHCGCCSKTITVSEFEVHAGSKLCQPFQNIFVETGVSLSQCQLDAWNKQDESERNGFHCIDFSNDDPNDDTCGICADGGDLICCDGCPSTFHQSCLDIQVLPSGDWLCSNCSCKFCGVAVCSNAREKDITASGLLTCSLCEEKYHEICVQQITALPLGLNTCNSFCGPTCRELFEQLQKLLGVKHELGAGLSWTLIQRSILDSKISFRELTPKVEINSKLAVAVAVMEECFLPIVDCRSGINMIHSVVYNCGSNCNRLNYSGFYTVILERDDEIVSAASIRIHGTRLAEMPFIGTRHMYRRQGMCRRLLNAIESTLCCLNVEKLVIPAISELLDTWTAVFGFKPLEELHKQEVKSVNMLLFPGVDLLQKCTLKHENVTNDSVAKAIELEDKHRSTPEVNNRSEKDSVGLDNLTSDENVRHHEPNTSEKVAAAESFPHAPGVLVNGDDATEGKNKLSEARDGPVFHTLGGENENCYSQSVVMLSAAGTESILPEAEPKMDSIIKPNIQEFTEGDGGDSHELNEEIVGTSSTCQSNVISVHTPDVVDEHPDTVSGAIVLVTDVSNSEYNQDSNHPNLCKMKSTSLEVPHAESDTTPCSETFLDASGEPTGHYDMKHKVATSEPIVSIADGRIIHHSIDTSPMQNVQGPCENVVCQDSEHSRQTGSTVSECNLQVTDNGSECHDFQMLQKTENASEVVDLVPKVAAIESSMHTSDEIVSHSAGVVTAPLNTTSDPSIFISAGSLPPSADIVGDPHGTTSMQKFQSPAENVKCHYSEDSKQTATTVFECNSQYTDNGSEYPDFRMLQQTEKASEVAGVVPNNGTVEVAVTDHDSRVVVEDAANSTSQVLDATFYVVTTCNSMAPVECRSLDLLPNSCDSSSEAAIPVPSEAEAAHQIINTDDPPGAFFFDSALQVSALETTHDTCDGKVKIVSIDSNEHALPQGSTPVSCAAASESIFAVASETSKFCKELLHQVPRLSPKGGKCTDTHPVEPNAWVSGEVDGHNYHNLKDEVAIAGANASNAEEISGHETSEIITN